MERGDLSGEVAIVTGASSGIGRATAIALAKAGAVVVVNHPARARSSDRASAVVKEITAAGGRGAAIAADITQEEEVESMVAEAVRRFGALHIMVANAGIERRGPIQDMTLADWQASTCSGPRMRFSARPPTVNAR
jgi:glucose 1-dehydrogenase